MLAASGCVLGLIAAAGFGPVEGSAAPSGADADPRGMSAAADFRVHNADGAPPGHTGGFGEPTCRACHAEYELGLDGTLAVQGLPERYRPGATYTVTLVLRSAGMERAGFQAAFRYAAGKRSGRSAGAPVPVDDRVAARADRETDVVYLQHAPGGDWTEGAEVASWSFAWTAPDEATGAVAFHAAANSANGDESPFGDIVYAVTDTVAGPPER